MNENITEVLEKYGACEKAVLDENFEYNDNEFFGATIFYVSDEACYPILKSGTIPKKTNEIVISDYIAYCLEIDVNDEIIHNSKSFLFQEYMKQIIWILD